MIFFLFLSLDMLQLLRLLNLKFIIKGITSSEENELLDNYSLKVCNCDLLHTKEIIS